MVVGGGKKGNSIGRGREYEMHGGSCHVVDRWHTAVATHMAGHDTGRWQAVKSEGKRGEGWLGEGTHNGAGWPRLLAGRWGPGGNSHGGGVGSRRAGRLGNVEVGAGEADG